MRIVTLNIGHHEVMFISNHKAIKHSNFDYHPVLNAKEIICDNSNKKRGKIVEKSVEFEFELEDKKLQFQDVLKPDNLLFKFLNYIIRLYFPKTQKLLLGESYKIFQKPYSNDQLAHILKPKIIQELVTDSDKTDQGFLIFVEHSYASIIESWFELKSTSKDCIIQNHFYWNGLELTKDPYDFQKNKHYNHSGTHFCIECDENIEQVFEYCFAINRSHDKSEIAQLYFGTITLTPDKDLSISPIIVLSDIETEIKTMELDLKLFKYLENKYGLAFLIGKTEEDFIELKNEHFEFVNY